MLLCGAVFYIASKFNSDLSTWQVGEVTTMENSTYTLPPLFKIRSFFWMLLYFPSFSVFALIIFLNNALSSFFFIPFLSLDYSLLLCAVFYAAEAFNSDLSTWQVGKVTNMEYSTYTLPPPLQDQVFFWLLLFPFFFPSSFLRSRLIIYV